MTQDSFGGPEVLKVVQVPRPVPLPTEVLVRVHAAAAHARGEAGRTRGKLVLRVTS